MNLHKWIGNPIGAGVLYVKKERIPDMKPLFGDVAAAATSINKLSHFGTTTLAVTMTIPDSLAYYQLLGTEKISRRLHYLKNKWVNSFTNHTAVEIVTPTDLSCAIASFRIRNRNSNEFSNQLFKQNGILTVGRTLGKDGCVRVTPSIYNSVDDINKMLKAVLDLIYLNVVEYG